jgi:hypothetical protein
MRDDGILGSLVGGENTLYIYQIFYPKYIFVVAMIFIHVFRSSRRNVNFKPDSHYLFLRWLLAFVNCGARTSASPSQECPSRWENRKATHGTERYYVESCKRQN